MARTVMLGTDTEVVYAAMRACDDMMRHYRRYNVWEDTDVSVIVRKRQV